jgi:hypothetical protein
MKRAVVIIIGIIVGLLALFITYSLENREHSVEQTLQRYDKK